MPESSPSSGGGVGRSSAMSCKISSNMCRGMATLATRMAMVPSWPMTQGPALISFSLRFDSDESLIGSGDANVRRKLPRLWASA